MLEVNDLHVSYGPHEALSGVSLTIDAGEIVVILGANGAGKSSLLQAIAGISEGSLRGSIGLEGQQIEHLSADQIVESGIAFVPEGRGIFGDLNVEENLLLGAYSEHARPAQQSNLAHVYELFPKLLDRSKQVSRTMSGGEQQMVAIGRALMSNPRYLLLDEPSLGLSPLLCKELFQSLRKIRDNGISVLMVEQNARQSLAIADRCYLIENGAVSGGGQAAAMLNDPAVQAAYLGGASSATANTAGSTAVATASSSSSKTFILPGSGPTIRPAIPVAEYVSRASRKTAPSTVLPSMSGEKPEITRPATPSVNPPASHEQQIADLLSSFERAAAAARLGASNNSLASNVKTMDSGEVTGIGTDSSVVSSPFEQSTRRTSAANAENPLPVAQVFRRSHDGQLQPTRAVVDKAASDNKAEYENGVSSALQVFRRGADGKLHPVRS